MERQRRGYDPFGYEGYTVGTPDSARMNSTTQVGAMAAICASPDKIEPQVFVRKQEPAPRTAR